MILEALAAVTDVVGETRADIDTTPISQVHACVDVALIDDRLGEALKPRSDERKAHPWMRAFWTTLDLCDFGTPLEIPQLDHHT